MAMLLQHDYGPLPQKRKDFQSNNGYVQDDI